MFPPNQLCSFRFFVAVDRRRCPVLIAAPNWVITTLIQHPDQGSVKTSMLIVIACIH